MDAVLNFHVIDPHNLGDMLSSPSVYVEFPGCRLLRLDITEFETYLTDPDRVPALRDTLAELHRTGNRLHVILGGGGLLAPRFQTAVAALKAKLVDPSGGKIIAWGVGQQSFKLGSSRRKICPTDPQLANTIAQFPYDRYVSEWDIVGIRDCGFGLTFEWVPCVSCLHPAFDRERAIAHEFVAYSHAKYQLKLPGVPTLDHTEKSLDRVLDFLGSGATVVTSSYHGAYWATLLGRKVLAFPFTSKFLTLKHPVGIYPTPNWKRPGIYWRPFTETFLNKFTLDIQFSQTFRCQTTGWQQAAQDLPQHPNALSECRDRTRQFYQSVCDAIGCDL